MAAPKTYRINLVRSLRERERKAERQRRVRVMSGVACFAVLALALLYSGFTVWKMEKVLRDEERKLEAIRAEYAKYTAARMIVDKGDVELLHNLQGRGIFWTKKLAALAKHLPDGYAITGFTYKAGELRVTGNGLVTSRQDQLLVLDGYLNRLRADSTFSDVFRQLYLNTAQRESGKAAGRLTFEFSAVNPEAQGKP